jgi:hypothetical protein
LIGKFVFDGYVIPQNMSIDYRALGDIPKEFHQVTIRQGCKFFGSNFIFNGCDFDEFVIFDSNFNTFINCKYMGQDILPFDSVATVNFKVRYETQILEHIPCYLTMIRTAHTSHIYFTNILSGVSIRSYEDFPAVTGLDWNSGCIKHYVKAMQKNFELNDKVMDNGSS